MTDEQKRNDKRDASAAPSASSDDEDLSQQDLQAPRADSQAQPAQPMVTASCSPPAPTPFPALVLAAGAAAAAAALYSLVRRLRCRNKVQRAAVGKHQVFSAVLALQQPSLPLPPPATPSLAGRTLVLSDRLAVQSLETRFGCQAWKSEQVPAQYTYGPADVLVAAGAHGTAIVFGDPLGLGPLLFLSGAGTPNPAGRGRVHGGGEYGAAASMAAGLADLALGVDELGTACVPAACCGAYALRTTAGVLSLEGASTASHSLAAPALMAADPQLLLKAGQALRLPGGGATDDVLKYLVAEDFFAACGKEPRRMMPAVVAAVKRWAGPDQAQALSLCEWLYHRVTTLTTFMSDGGAAAQEAKQQRSEQVLQALASVAEVVQQREFVERYGAWVEAHQEQLEPGVVEYWQQARQVEEGRYRGATAVAAQLHAAMRAALADSYVFVLPTTAGPAPLAPASHGAAGSSEREALEVFRRRCIQFAAMAALTGVPQAVLPLPLPGGMPLSISLLALPKRDLALLQAAAKLGPMLAEEVAALVAEETGGEQSSWRPRADSASEAAAAGSNRLAGSRCANGRRKVMDGVQAAAQAAAEERKEEGNTAFRAGRYEEAVRQYSAAIQLCPQAAVYHANRAMAYLKLGSYSAAEADCDQALKLELSAKALLRRGSARLAQGNAAGAQADFRQVLALEPQNRQARDELRGLEALGRNSMEGPEQLPVF